MSEVGGVWGGEDNRPEVSNSWGDVVTSSVVCRILQILAPKQKTRAGTPVISVL